MGDLASSSPIRFLTPGYRYWALERPDAVATSPVCEIDPSTPDGYWHVAFSSLAGGSVEFSKNPFRAEVIPMVFKAYGFEFSGAAFWAYETEPREQNKYNRSSSGLPKAPAVKDVYFIQANIGGPIKIGKSEAVEDRMEQLQVGCPFPLKILATLPESKFTEAALHQRFARFRLHGEWFRDAPELLAFIAKEADA